MASLNTCVLNDPSESVDTRWRSKRKKRHGKVRWKCLLKSEGGIRGGVMQLSSRRSMKLEEGRSGMRGHNSEDSIGHLGLISQYNIIFIQNSPSLTLLKTIYMEYLCYTLCTL